MKPGRGSAVAVVGGGMAGLTAALTLARAGAAVTVYGDRAGRVDSIRPDPEVPDWRIETGASSVTYRAHAVFQLAAAVGLGEPGSAGSPWREMGPNARDRFVADGDRLRAVGPGLVGLRHAPEFARGLFQHRPPGAGESIADWGRLQFGAGLASGPARAFTVGVWGCAPDRIGFADAWPEVWQELQLGSPMVAQRKMAAAAPKRTGTWFLSEGMGTLPNATVEAIREAGGRLVDEAVTSLEALDVDRVVVATDATDAARLVAPVDAQAAALLGAVEHSPIAVVHWLAAPQGRPTGFGMLVPAPDVILGTVFLSDVRDQVGAPWAPDGLHAFSTMVGGHANPGQLQRPDSELIDEVVARHTRWFGSEPRVRAAHVVRWPRAVSIPVVGHRDRIRGLLERQGRLVYAGSYLAGGTLDDAVASGFAAARRALAPAGGEA